MTEHRTRERDSAERREFKHARSQRRRETTLADLADLPRWVAWREEVRNQKPTKIPYDPHTNGQARIPTDPTTWGTRKEAERRWQRLRRDDDVGGVGIVLGDLDNSTHLLGIDLDSCRNGDKLAPWAQRIVERFDTYSEISPSGCGLKLFFLAASADMPTIKELMGGKNRRAFAVGEHREIAVDRARYYAVTDDGEATPLRTVEVEDVRWLVEVAGPEYVESHHPNQHAGRGRDESPSGYAHRILLDCIRRGLDKPTAFAELKRDTGPGGEWGRTVPERELELSWRNALAWHHAHPKSMFSWDEPDTSLLDDRRGDLPKFPVAELGDKLQHWVKRAARGSGTTPDHVAVPLLGIASSLIGSARRVRASKSWSQPMTCWTATVGASGTGKSPGIEAIKKPLDSIDGDFRAAADEQRRQHDLLVEKAKAAQAEWKARIKEAAKNNRAPPPKPADADDPAEFIVPQLYVTDTTIEAIPKLLKARPRGTLLVMDELAALFANMSRYSGGDDQQFWLNAWDGAARPINRANKPAVLVDCLLVGVVGGMQPDKLEDCFAGAADGMYARFLFSWPDAPRYQPLSDDVDEIDDAIESILNRLARLPKCEPPHHKVPLSTNARAAFERVRKKVHQDIDALSGRERDWWAKIPAHVLRLAGTLAYLDWAIREHNEPRQILAPYVNAASRLVLDYFWPHARACLRQIGLNQYHTDARRVLRWLSAKKLKEVGREDVRRDALGQRLDATDTEAVMDFLTRAGWVRRLETSTGGRPKVRWEVNPQTVG